MSEAFWQGFWVAFGKSMGQGTRTIVEVIVVVYTLYFCYRITRAVLGFVWHKFFWSKEPDKKHPKKLKRKEPPVDLVEKELNRMKGEMGLLKMRRPKPWDSLKKKNDRP